MFLPMYFVRASLLHNLVPTPGTHRECCAISWCCVDTPRLGFVGAHKPTRYFYARVCELQSWGRVDKCALLLYTAINWSDLVCD